MSDNYDPAKMPCNPQWNACKDPMCPNCWGSGPGGNTTLIENNEKGILETGLFNVISRHENSYMGSNHDAYRQGTYTTNSVGDND